MDVAALLRDACQRAQVSPSELAVRAGCSSSAVSQLLRGRSSPTTRTLDKLLAGVGLQVRVSLEPLLADVDARVDALLEGTTTVAVAAVQRFAEKASVEHTWRFEDETTGEVGFASGRITWALDGATALNLHGLAYPADLLSVAIVFDEAARAWLTKGLMRGTGHAGVVGWWSCTGDEARRALSELAVGGQGMLKIRLVEELPCVIEIQLPGTDLVVPAVSIDEVERTQPQLAEVLARLRTRRARP